MNEIKKAIASLFSAAPPAPRPAAHHDLDYEPKPPAVRSKAATGPSIGALSATPQPPAAAAGATTAPAFRPADFTGHQDALVRALCRNRPADVERLLPLASYADKMEALASTLNLKPAAREKLKPLASAIIDSLQQHGSASAALTADRQAELSMMKKLLKLKE